MRYRDLIQFEPIETVIQLRDAEELQCMRRQALSVTNSETQKARCATRRRALKIGKQQAKIREYLTPFAKFYGNHPREARSYAD